MTKYSQTMFERCCSSSLVMMSVGRLVGSRRGGRLVVMVFLGLLLSLNVMGLLLSLNVLGLLLSLDVLGLLLESHVTERSAFFPSPILLLPLLPLHSCFYHHYCSHRYYGIPLFYGNSGIEYRKIDLHFDHKRERRTYALKLKNLLGRPIWGLYTGTGASTNSGLKMGKGLEMGTGSSLGYGM